MSGDVPVTNSDAKEITASLFNVPDFTEHPRCCRPLGSRVQGQIPNSDRFHSVSGEDKGVRPREWGTRGDCLPHGEKGTGAEVRGQWSRRRPKAQGLTGTDRRRAGIRKEHV